MPTKYVASIFAIILASQFSYAFALSVAVVALFICAGINDKR
jgi:hypothetical protein